MLKPTQDKNALLTPEEIEQGINDYYWSEDMPMDTGITRENYAVALAQIAKLERLGYHIGLPPSIEEALNSGDGVYRP